MLTKSDFIRRVLGEAPARTRAAKKDTGHIAGFDFIDDAAEAEASEDTRFAQLLLEDMFGLGQSIPRAAVIRSTDAVARYIPDHVLYWPKTPTRPHHTLLIEAELTHHELLAIPAFKSRQLAYLDNAEDAIARLAAEALEGFQRGAEDLQASALRGQKHETLCVVSIVDERDGHTGRLVCFGTFNAKTEGFETFFLTEHARTWDRAQARDRLELIYDRQFKKLGDVGWQDAFTTTDERKQAEKLLEVCTKKNVVEKDVQECILDLLDTIAKGFGLRKKADVKRHLQAFPLPAEHDIGIDSEERERKYGGVNPFSGVSLRDHDSRLLGYIVYPLKTKGEAVKLQQHLEKHNRFHNVLVVYPDTNQARIELWQGREQLTGNLRKGHTYKDAADVVNLLSRFFVVSKAKVRNPTDLAQELAYRARFLRGLALRQLADEPEQGPLRNLYNAFKVALVHDQEEGEFADAFAQTITYGMLTTRWLGNDELATTGDRFTRKNALKHLPKTSRFLQDLFKSALGVKLDEQRGRLLWLVDDIADLLDRIDVTYVFGAGDKGSDTATDPVIHFYEPFLAAYDKELKNKRGVFFTPRPVVSYIVRSVHELLQTEFGLQDGLASTDTWGDVAKRIPGLNIPKGTQATAPFVQILDPATGTGTFLYECIELIERTVKARWCHELGIESWNDDRIAARWSEYVSKHLLPRLYGFELMMASYAVAHLKLSFKLGETGYRFGSADRLHVHLTNTLEEPSASANPKLAGLFVTLAEEAQEVNRIKNEARFTVVVGNPPYAGLSSNMTEEAQRLVDPYKVVDGKALNERKLWLQDDYVKFVRLAQTTIEPSGSGVLGLITNHGYVDNPTFRGMRRSLMGSFGRLQILDLHGNANKKEVAPDGAEDNNVFDIRQGVAICLAARNPASKSIVAHADLWGVRESKYAWLAENSVSSTKWLELRPDAPYYFFEPVDVSFREEYERGWPINELFPVSSAGFITARDHFVIDFDESALLSRIADFADPAQSDAEIRRKYFAGCGSDKYPDGDTRGWKVPLARKQVQADSQWRKRVRTCLYRPFDFRRVYWAEWMVDWPRPELTRHLDIEGNYALLTTRITKDNFAAFATRHVPGHKTVGAYDVNYAFPLFVDLSGRQATLLESGGREGPQPNVAPKFGAQLGSALNSSVPKGKLLPTGVSAEAVFQYVYAICHIPTYRTRYAEFLKVDFPRIPLPASRALFEELAAVGARLLDLHLLDRKPEPLAGLSVVGSMKTIVDKVSYSDETVWIDKQRTAGFRGVPESVWTFQIGGFQVCEKWLKDRRERALSKHDVEEYQNILAVLHQTEQLMRELDTIVERHGGWPAAFVTKASVS